MDENSPYAGQKVIEITLDSGEKVYVRPLSIYLINALSKAAAERFPLPDKALYEKELDPAKALEPGQKIPAQENPEYQKALAEIQAQQSHWTNEQAVFLAVEPVVPKAELIAKYQPALERLRALVAVPEDPWEATFKLCLVGSATDYRQLTQAVTGQLRITEADVVNGMRIFRPALFETGLRRLSRSAAASGLAAQDEPEQQPVGGTVRHSASVGLADAERVSGKRSPRRTDRDAESSSVEETV